MKSRKQSFEALRIVAMCMIIAMHYMTKGMALPKLSTDSSLSNHLWWLFYAFCLVAPNAYVLISGYFLVDKWNEEFSVKAYLGRGVRLVCEVLFYSWLVPVVLGAFGVIDITSFEFGEILTMALPIEQEHYWFATSYIILYLLSPVLSMGIKKLNKEQLKGVIIALLVLFSGFKSVNPYLISWDRYGCDLAWFICLYIVAAYIKIYGFEKIKNVKQAFGLYAGLAIVYFAECALAALIVRKTGKLEYFMDMIYSYNHILVFAASVCLFAGFMYLSEKEKEREKGSIICLLGSYTFGIYLLHENLSVRHSWYKWLGIDNIQGKGFGFIHMLLCIVIVFAVGALIDAIRTGIFNCFIKNKKESRN